MLLSVRMKEAPNVYLGSQPFDHSKRQRGKTSWMEYTGGSLGDGKIFDLFCACMQSESLVASLKNTEAKIRKELEALLDPSAAVAKAAAAKAAAAKGKAVTPLTGVKRSLGDMDLGKMRVAQINKMLRQMQEGPATSKGSSSSSGRRLARVRIRRYALRRLPRGRRGGRGRPRSLRALPVRRVRRLPSSPLEGHVLLQRRQLWSGLPEEAGVVHVRPLVKHQGQASRSPRPRPQGRAVAATPRGPQT